jgi:Flp pilus assembly pilin Flp
MEPSGGAGYARAVRRGILRSESGQTMPEYALIIGGIALVCIVAVLLLGDRISGLFESTSEPLISGPPAPAGPKPAYPLTVDDCLNGGWQSFGHFTNEADCVDFVNGLAP